MNCGGGEDSCLRLGPPKSSAFEAGDVLGHASEEVPRSVGTGQISHGSLNQPLSELGYLQYEKHRVTYCLLRRTRTKELYKRIQAHLP